MDIIRDAIRVAANVAIHIVKTFTCKTSMRLEKILKVAKSALKFLMLIVVEKLVEKLAEKMMSLLLQYLITNMLS